MAHFSAFFNLQDERNTYKRICEQKSFYFSLLLPFKVFKIVPRYGVIKLHSLQGNIKKETEKYFLTFTIIFPNLNSNYANSLDTYEKPPGTS